MPIEILFQREAAGPVVVCDLCGKRILGALDGNALWLAEHNDKESHQIGPIVFTHKSCNYQFMVANRPTAPHQIWESNGLEVFLVYLTDNVQLQMNDAKQKAKLLSMIAS